MWVCRTSASSPLEPRSARRARSATLTGANRRPTEHSRAAHRNEVKCPVEIGLAAGAQCEVACGDRGCEPAVEALGESHTRMHRIPAQPQGQLVYPQFAGVEETKQRHRGEVLTTQPLELVPAVLVHMPRVVRAPRA